VLCEDCYQKYQIRVSGLLTLLSKIYLSLSSTSYGLNGPGFESLWERIFRICPGKSWGPPLQWVADLFPGVKWSELCVENPPNPAPRIKKE